ncbi:MAG: efflux RND transporter permease subunit [Planctomycetota bacterium]
MNLAPLFFRNRRLLVLTVALILVAGLSGYAVLPRQEDPSLKTRFANVTTFLPGATAQRVDALVSEEIENILLEIEEIRSLDTTSRPGVSKIYMELDDWVEDIESVWTRVRDELDDARPNLPAEASDPDFEEEDTRAYALVVGLRWISETPLQMALLRRHAEELEQALRHLPGTEEVVTHGEPDEEIRVTIRPAALAALGLSPIELARQIESSDAKIAAGEWHGSETELQIELDSELDSLDRIRDIPIRRADGSSFARLGDLADLERTVREPLDRLALLDGRPGIAVGVRILDNWRLDEWRARAGERLRAYSAELPVGLELTTLFDQNRYTSERLDGLMRNLALGALAVIAVIFLMMGWRSALLVGTALPLSTLMVFAGMRAFEIPIEQMSVTGLIIALGLLIDNAIVIVDEVRRALRAGRPPLEAVRESVAHLTIPLLGSTLTTILAFLPIALMPGSAGEFVGSIAATVILALVSSLFLALTVIPALTGILGVRGATAPAGWQHGLPGETAARVGRPLLTWMFVHPLRGVFIALLLPVLGFVAWTRLTEQFFPPADRDMFHIEVELGGYASLERTRAVSRRITDRLEEEPDIERIDWFLGESAPRFYYNVLASRERSPGYAQAMVVMRSADAANRLVPLLQEELDRTMPEARILVRRLEQGPPFAAPIELQLLGADPKLLRETGDRIRLGLAEQPDVIHVTATASEAIPKLELRVDESAARRAGLEHADIARQLAAGLEGAAGGSILEDTESLPVRVRLPDRDRGEMEGIASMDLIPPGGESRAVPLAAVADWDLEPERASLYRYQGQPVNTIRGYLRMGVLPQSVLEGFHAWLDEQELPPGIHFELEGEAAERNRAVTNLMSSVGLLFTLMAAVLVLSFGSFRLAALIGLVAALAVGLGFGALWLFGFPFGFMAIVGTMGLIGVAINDSIVVLAAIRRDDLARMGDVDGLVQVVSKESRHVLSTTFTTIAGFLPLLIQGGEFWPPTAITIAAGVTGATILALILVPAAYRLLRPECPPSVTGA